MTDRRQRRSSGDSLDVVREQKLVDWLDIFQRVAAVDEDARIAGERAGLQDTATTVPTLQRASCLAWSSAPERAGSNTTASKPSSSRADIGMRKRSRTLASMGLRPCAWRAAACSAAIDASSCVDGQHAGASRQGKREGAQAAEEVRNAFCLGCCRQHQAHHLVFRRLHGLHERLRRRGDIDPAERENRLSRQHERVTPDRQAGQAALRPQRGQTRTVLVGRVEMGRNPCARRRRPAWRACGWRPLPGP